MLAFGDSWKRFEDLIGVHTSLGKVFIIPELKGYGGMFISLYLICMFRFFKKWKNKLFLIHVMTVTSFVYTMYMLALKYFAPLSTEGNRFPLQLYTGGSIGSPLFSEEIDFETYGIDPEISLSDEEEKSSVTVPDTVVELSEIYYEQQFTHCKSVVTSQLYKDTVQTLFQLVQDENPA